MAKLELPAGTTNKLIRVFALDTTSTTGAGKTGLLYSSVTGYYIREGASADVAISMVTATVGTFTSGGWKEIDSTNMAGWYEVGIPSLAIATGAASVSAHFTASGMAPIPLEIELTATSNQDGVHGGMTAIPNAAAGATNGLPVQQSNGTVSAQLAAGVVHGGTGATVVLQTASGSAFSITSSDTTAAALQITESGSLGVGVSVIATSGTSFSFTGLTVNSNLGTTQPVNFNGTGSTAYVKSDAIQFGGQALTVGSGVTIGAFVGNATHAIAVDSSGGVTFNNTSIPTATNVTNLGGTAAATAIQNGAAAAYAVANPVTITGAGTVNGIAIAGTYQADGTTMTNGQFVYICVANTLGLSGGWTPGWLVSDTPESPVNYLANDSLFIYGAPYSTASGTASGSGVAVQYGALDPSGSPAGTLAISNAALATAAALASVATAVNAITTNTSRAKLSFPQLITPASGSTPYQITLNLMSEKGALEDADTNTVTIHAADQSGSSLDSHLGSTTMTRTSTGLYTATFTVQSTDTFAEATISATYTVGSVAMGISATSSLLPEGGGSGGTTINNNYTGPVNAIVTTSNAPTGAITPGVPIKMYIGRTPPPFVWTGDYTFLGTPTLTFWIPGSEPPFGDVAVHTTTGELSNSDLTAAFQVPVAWLTAPASWLCTIDDVISGSNIVVVATTQATVSDIGPAP